ncbi:MAG TPA: ACT domain-containing protein [Clostridiales bacterium]|nr:ACT domain-containing protein [Clostridiales bacterium]
MSGSPVSNVTVTYNVALVTIHSLHCDTRLLADIFSAVAQKGINIDMISQSPPYRDSITISFSLPADRLVDALSVLNSFKAAGKDLRVEVDADNTKLQVYGEGMRNMPGVAARIFSILADEGIEIKLVTTSETDISYLIYEKDVDRARNAISKEYGL